MKILIILLLLSSPVSIFAQRYFMRVSDSAGHFCFVRKTEGGAALPYKESYVVLKGSQYNYMTRWGVSDDGTLLWTNGQSVYRCDWSPAGSKLIYRDLYWIHEFFVRGYNLYIVYNPSKEYGTDEGRYAKGLRFCRINLKSLKKEELPFPAGYNATNLTVSPGEKWVSFINTRGDEYERYKLVLYGLSTREIVTIDSANYKQGSWFGDVDMFNSCYWTGPASLLYFKHAKLNDNGEIRCYRPDKKRSGLWLKHFPERDFSWYSVLDGYLYLSGRSEIYKIKEGFGRQTIYDTHDLQKNIHNAIILQ